MTGDLGRRKLLMMLAGSAGLMIPGIANSEFSAKDCTNAGGKWLEERKKCLVDMSMEVELPDAEIKPHPEEDRIAVYSPLEVYTEESLPRLDKKPVKQRRSRVRPSRKTDYDSVDEILAGIVGGEGCFTRIGGRFGDRRKTHTHHGVDIYASKGCSVRTPLSGRVRKIGYDGKPPEGGLYIILEHEIEGMPPHISPEFHTVYMHLNASSPGDRSKVYVEIGDFVRQGQQIAEAGRTGIYRSKTHLHFEVREKRGKYFAPVDPEEFFKNLKNHNLI